MPFLFGESCPTGYSSLSFSTTTRHLPFLSADCWGLVAASSPLAWPRPGVRAGPALTASAAAWGQERQPLTAQAALLWTDQSQELAFMSPSVPLPATPAALHPVQGKARAPEGPASQPEPGEQPPAPEPQRSETLPLRLGFVTCQHGSAASRRPATLRGRRPAEGQQGLCRWPQPHFTWGKDAPNPQVRRGRLGPFRSRRSGHPLELADIVKPDH